ncbi:leucine-rich repeat serine/threonine-protein kinase 2 isoform X1 [Bufo gargarizans]|uniref:leucine-rich repeat serine/threonine-protein kinase 2 isoform X1 n=1 Tax=Bufo gargarizans TaxID=30331 RepID=UPI001CF25605|nr:leucine-rich repeat serine/threonine-protein kinase 2 isoform X1 [Bufo gargarizans]
MSNAIELEENVKKLVVRLQNVEKGKQIDNLVQILEDLHAHTFCDDAPEIFSHVNVHLPLLLVLESYMRVAVIQEVGWSLLCRLIMVYPNILHSLHTPVDIGHEWEVLGVHQQILKILSMYLTNRNVLMVGLKALTSILESDVIHFLVLDHEADVFLLIFEAMKLFSDKEDIQIYSCQALYLLLMKVPEEQLIEFVESKDHLIIFRVLMQYKDTESVIYQALRVLIPLAAPPCNVEVLMSGNVRCYNIIMEAMKTFPNSEKIQEVCCCLFHKLTFGSFFNILVLNEAHEVIIKALISYSANSKLQAAALTCLALLTETIFLNKDLDDGEDRDDNRGHLYWFEASFKALKLHKKNTEVQEAACWALNNLLLYHPELHDRIGDEQNKYPVHREVMLSMLMHSSSKEVFQATTTALATLSGHNVIIRKILLEKGVHINVLEIMKEHLHSPEAAESACRVLLEFFNGSSFNLDVLTVTMTSLLNAMKKHKKVSGVQLEALRVMVQIMCDDTTYDVLNNPINAEDSSFLNLPRKVIRNQCLLEGTHKFILQALNKFISNPGIQACGLKVVSSLSECSGSLELLSEQGTFDTILHSIQMYPGNEEIQYFGISLLSFLITRKNICIAIMDLLSTHLVSTLQRYEDVVRIQEEGFRAALTLMKLSHSFAKLLELQDFDTVLFYQISMCLANKRSQKFQVLCYRCFAEMTLDDNVKNKFLAKACAENHMIIVEALLLLGADVNKKPKHTSLIVQVCEKGTNAKLVELLLNHGVHEQDSRKALEISIKNGNNEVISLLLKKLGLDVANNSICLGGFHMGKIQPSWIHPLFSEKQNTQKNPSVDHEGSKDLGPILARMVFRYQSKLYGCRSLGESPSMPELIDKDDSSTNDSFDDVFANSDDLDSEGSEGMHPMKKSHSFVGLDIHKENSKLNHVTSDQRRTNSLGGFGDEPNLRRRKDFPQIDYPCKALLSLHMKRTDSTSSLTEKEHIRTLDLSANDLESIDLINKKCLLASHLERLEKLELQQNALASIPKSLCDVFKSLTYLDLRNNNFKTFPAAVLEMSSISFLDLSRNEIGPSIDLHTSAICLTLKHLNLSYNQLKEFPECTENVAQRLEELILEGNCIADIHVPLCLPELRTLNLNKNMISSLAPNILSNCGKLEVFCAMANKLAMVPSIPSKMTTLRLSHNEFTSIPKEILQLSYLRTVDLSNNQISNLPGPLEWASLSLREILLSHNQIHILNLEYLRKDASRWSRLEKLHLSHNMIKEIPPEIGFLVSVTCFDISHNPDLRSFPDEMGKLTKIWDLPLDGLHLDFDLKRIGCKARDLIRFLQQRLKKAVPYNRMKLLIMGNTGSGKTTLVHQLMKEKHPGSGSEKATIGIDVKDWPIPIRGKVKKEITLNVWDFAGQEEFYSTHPHFMTPRALFLVVYDLSKGASEVDAIKPWLFNIKARASSSPVILVGTHLDVSDEKQRKACINKIKMELFNQRELPCVQDFHFVDATEESDALAKLRKSVIKECLNFKIRDQAVLGQLIPDSYLELEKRILIEKKNAPIEFPVINHKRLQDIVQENRLDLDEHELQHAVHFLNESGVLLHFEDPALQLRDLYFVDPEWLCKIMAQILTVKVEGCQRYPKGIIHCIDVEKFLFKKKKFPKNYISQYFKLLEKFQIALPLGEEQLLIPSSLSDHRPVIELPHCENSEVIIRLYEMSYFPMGFWSRLINRLLEVSSYMLSGRERVQRPNRMYWRQGIYLNWSPEAYCLVESSSLHNNPNSFLKITVPSCRKGCILLGQVVDHIDSLMEEWFPGLLETDISGEGDTLLKKWVLYSFDDGQEHKKILLSDLLLKAEEGDLLLNPEDPRSTIPISQIAPDIVLADLPRNIMLNNEELEFDQSAEYLLGDGGFGSVYRAVYRGKDVAVKIFNKHTSPRLLRQELTVLSHLHHPSLVCLLAAGVRPRMLVMELASKSSLDHLLQQDSSGLTRTLQHRIALHVADGLSYLHSSMIIYRDLKPHNVLLFTLYPNSAVVAKIADYGIAQYCCRMGIKTSEGTPGFRAPEVARGNVIYNQQADVYSLGLLLYDILTAGARMVEGLKFPNEFDELAISGKLPDPVKEYNCVAWPEVEVLIKKCLKENPQERPISAKVYEILNSAELLCLMRNLVIPSPLTAECMVATSPRFKVPTVMVGSGSSDKGQISCLNLIKGGHTCEDFCESRILCLAFVTLPEEREHWILAGSQSGDILAAQAEDLKKKHFLQKMPDSVTCFLFSGQIQQSQKKYFLLVGTANGHIAIFEAATIKCTNVSPMKMLRVGDISTPVMCLCESTYSSEKTAVWGVCGTQILSLSNDFAVQKTIETKNAIPFSHGSASDSNITSVAVDKYIYVAKKYSPHVEIWDKKTEKLCETLDCARFLKEEIAKQRKIKKEDAYTARVKALFLQKNTALWVGTGGGHILLIDLSTRRPIRIISSFCDSIRCMVPSQLEKGSVKNVVLVLGCRCTPQKDIQSFLSVWDMNLPHEVQNLKKHNEIRQELAEKARGLSLD